MFHLGSKRKRDEQQTKPGWKVTDSKVWVEIYLSFIFV